jgi:hypothetical protein
MSVNWSDEQYVRLYKVDSANWRMGPWEGRCVLPLVLRELDRAGMIDLGEYGMAAVADAIKVPTEIVEKGMGHWLKCGTFEVRGTVLVMPNYVEAQECSHSDKARKAEERARKRDQFFAQERFGSDVTNRDNEVTERNGAVTNCDEKSQAVTVGHEPSQVVTSGHSLLCSALLCSALHCSEETSSPPARNDEMSRNVTSAEPLKLTAPPNTPTQPTRPEGSRDLDPSALTNAERAVHAAIVADESLRPIVRTPAKLAKDLVRVGPGVSVVNEIVKAGAWLRANPARRKKNGAKFLLGWVEREQEKRGGTAQCARPTGGPPRQPIAEMRAWKMPEEEA